MTTNARPVRTHVDTPPAPDQDSRGWASVGLSRKGPGWRALTDEESAAGRRFTADGLLCGTPRSREDDWRFDRSFVPAGVFEPNATAVWAVLDRLTWFTFADAEHVVDVAAQASRDVNPGGHHNDIYSSAQAARTAGGRRYQDWQDIEEIARIAQEMVRPPEAGLARHSWSAACYIWSIAFMSLGCRAAQAYLVADRPELSDSAFDWLTAPWRTAFPSPALPDTRPTGGQQ